MNGVSIICPVTDMERAKICAAACLKYAPSADVGFELVFELDEEKIGCTKMVKKLVEKAKYDTVCFLGEDCIPQADFLKNAIDKLMKETNGNGVVFFHDGFNQCFRHCHWLASKSMLPKLDGEFFHTGYWHAFCDDELAERAQQMGLYAIAEEAIVLHDNPVISGKVDATHSHTTVYAQEKYMTDMILYGKRRANDWTTPGPDYFRVGIAIPLIDKWLDKAFFISFITMQKPFDWCFQIPQTKILSMAGVRNSLLEKAMLDGCTHQVQLDTDQIYKSDVLIRLLQHRDKDIVGTRVHRRYPPFDVLMFRGSIGNLSHVSDEECFSDKLVKVASTGTGCIMINMSILPTLPTPWFREGDVDGEEGVGEDIYFTDLATRNGKEVYVDTSIDIDHMSQYLVNGSTYHLYKGLTGHEWPKEQEPVGERMTKIKYQALLEKAKAEVLAA